jgi:hypothetical protein
MISFWLLGTEGFTSGGPPDRRSQSVQLDQRRKFYVNGKRFQDIVGAVFNRDQLVRAGIEKSWLPRLKNSGMQAETTPTRH